MTFAEFEKLPEDPRGVSYELRHGEVTELAFPKHKHHKVQLRLRSLLDISGLAGVISMEFGFRPAAEYEYRKADVVFISAERWNSIPDEGYMQGAPDLVIEVLSPSNTAAEMLDKRDLCLE